MTLVINREKGHTDNHQKGVMQTLPMDYHLPPNRSRAAFSFGTNYEKILPLFPLLSPLILKRFWKTTKEMQESTENRI